MLLKALRAIVQSGGIVSLWGGLIPTLWRDLPFSALYWVLLESIRRHMSGDVRREHRFGAHFVGGTIAGAVAAFATTPMDVLKTHRQRSVSMSNGHESMRRCAEHVWREEGWRGFFRGVGPRVLKVAPASAVMISSYELLKKHLEGKV